MQIGHGHSTSSDGGCNGFGLTDASWFLGWRRGEQAQWLRLDLVCVCMRRGCLPIWGMMERKQWEGDGSSYVSVSGTERRYEVTVALNYTCLVRQIWYTAVSLWEKRCTYFLAMNLWTRHRLMTSHITLSLAEFHYAVIVLPHPIYCFYEESHYATVILSHGSI